EGEHLTADDLKRVKLRVMIIIRVERNALKPRWFEQLTDLHYRLDPKLAFHPTELVKLRTDLELCAEYTAKDHACCPGGGQGPHLQVGIPTRAGNLLDELLLIPPGLN